METKMFKTCFVCDSKKQFGPNCYELHMSQGWKALVCQSCRTANWDGIVPTDKFLQKLRKHGIAPVYNEQGWIPIPS